MTQPKPHNIRHLIYRPDEKTIIHFVEKNYVIYSTKETNFNSDHTQSDCFDIVGNTKFQIWREHIFNVISTDKNSETVKIPVNLLKLKTAQHYASPEFADFEYLRLHELKVGEVYAFNQFILSNNIYERNGDDSIAYKAISAFKLDSNYLEFSDGFMQQGSSIQDTKGKHLKKAANTNDEATLHLSRKYIIDQNYNNLSTFQVIQKSKANKGECSCTSDIALNLYTLDKLPRNMIGILTVHRRHDIDSTR